MGTGFFVLTFVPCNFAVLYYCPTTTNKKNKFFESLNAASQLYQRLYRMFNAGVFILTPDS